jgi:flagellar biosynthesis/type III secretory pathway M-ring protein FliF/YscJ
MLNSNKLLVNNKYVILYIMYLLALCIVVLIGLFIIMRPVHEPFISESFDLVKNPVKHVNRLKRKMRITRNDIHQKHIRPMHNKLKKIFM